MIIQYSAVVDRKRSHSARFVRRRIFLAIAALLSVLAGCARAPKTQPQPVNLQIESDGDFLAFRPDTLTCPTGALVHLTFHHAGKIISARHDWVLVYPHKLESLSKDVLANDGILPANDPRVIVATGLCDKGQSVTIQFTAPAPGDYPFLCSTHADDMRGILHVTK